MCQKQWGLQEPSPYQAVPQREDTMLIPFQGPLHMINKPVFSHILSSIRSHRKRYVKLHGRPFREGNSGCPRPTSLQELDT